MRVISLSRRVAPALPFLCAILLAAACGGEDEERIRPPGEGRGGTGSSADGPLVIIGGALSADNAAVYTSILERREGDGPVCILPTAAADAPASGASAVQRFERYGGVGSAVSLPFPADVPEAAHDPSLVEQIGSCSAFFFVGGQQSRVTRVFGTVGATTPALDAIRQRFAQGAVISGSSAGAAIMGHPMIGGGSSDGAVQNGVLWSVPSPEEWGAAAGDTGGGTLEGAGDGEEEGTGGVRLEGGFGLLEGVLLDQHFLARGRIGRLLVAVADPRSPDRGMGVDENTALVVEGDLARVVGVSGVVLVDGSTASGTGGDGDPTREGGVSAVRGMTVHLLGAGDAYHLGRREVIPASRGAAAPDSSAGPGSPSGPGPSAGGGPGGEGDVFARWTFLRALWELSLSPETAMDFRGDGYTVLIRKGPGFGWSAAGEAGEEGVQGVGAGFSAGPFLVDLLPSGGE